MTRKLSLASAAMAVMIAPLSALAHFAFVVPDDGGATARVMMSETLVPDTDVSVQILSDAKLTVRTADGRETPLSLGEPDGDVFKVSLPGEGTRVVRGLVDLGFTQRGNGTPHLLIYHPKAIVGDAFDPSTQLGWSVPVELVPVGEPGNAQLKLVVNGQPQPDMEVTVVYPGGIDEVVKTDDKGLTPVLEKPGQYAAWARYWQDVTGERDGQTYEQVRHYAMLVFDVPEASQGNAQATQDTDVTQDLPGVETLTPLPEAVASHGAVASDGWLYVFGGHTAPTHEYHTQAVSGAFHRVKLDDLQPGATPQWEKLPDSTPVQGMNLAANDGKIYLLGGMQPQNAVDTREDNRSLASAQVFDPAEGVWSTLPLMPEPRSSHDVVVIDDTLYVVGGWDMHGDDETWAGDMFALDLSSASARWERIEQPFKRRALITAALDGKLFVIGGMNDAEEIPNSVDIYNPADGTWTRGPDLPAGRFNGFSPAAAVLDGKLYVSVADGSLLQLNDAGDGWETVGKTSPRIVHRVIPDGDRLLLVGGAWDGGNLDLIESVDITEAGQAKVEADAKPTTRLSADASSQAKPATGQTHCPVMPDEEVIADEAYIVEYAGTQVLLCCRTCVRKWKAAPERFLDANLLPQLSGI